MASFPFKYINKHQIIIHKEKLQIIDYLRNKEGVL
jgi:hypothetical protein